VNGELLNGRTPLHAAAEFGNVETAACLLRRSHVKRAVKDRFGNTPLMIAAQHGKKDILEMLAPWNHLDLLSSDEKEACRRFEATIGLFSSYLRFSTFASGS
jgi:ankyrin repeat protein